MSLIFRSLPKSGKLNFSIDLSMTETEASECGLEVFYEKCMTLIDKLEHIGLCKEEFLILKVNEIVYSIYSVIIEKNIFLGHCPC